jgi:hypothetical protein
MSNTKQLRITDPLEIRKRISEFPGKKINIVFTDSRVIVGTLMEIKPDGIVLQNMRLKNEYFPFNQLTEIYFDTLVA